MQTTEAITHLPFIDLDKHVCPDYSNCRMRKYVDCFVGFCYFIRHMLLRSVSASLRSVLKYLILEIRLLI